MGSVNKSRPKSDETLKETFTFFPIRPENRRFGWVGLCLIQIRNMLYIEKIILSEKTIIEAKTMLYVVLRTAIVLRDMNFIVSLF